ncbi:MAG: ECF transporter S component [Clostridiales bacterium]|jgi:energy-coupling factor transport system substrate-specific component|nr:ECF transporter S component [Clostridiales bacterium]
MGGKTEKSHSIKSDFSMLAILIIPIAVAVNFVGGQLASLLKLPMYLDCIGTIFTAMLCGPWVGALAGGLTNVVTGIANPISFAFIPVNIATGLVAGFLARANMFSNWWKWLVSMVILAASSIIVTAPIVILVFGGITGSGPSMVVAGALAAGANIMTAFLSGDGIFTVIDRTVSYLLGYLVIGVIPSKTLIKFGCGENYIKKASVKKSA